MLVDVVNYGGELDLLLARLDYMKADETVIVESDHQFQGQFKGWTFEERDGWSLVGDYSMTYVKIPWAGSSNPWENEHHQRRAAKSALEQMNLPGDAIVGVFDVDEFPDRDLIRATNRVVAWNMPKYQMSLFWYQAHEVTGFSGPWSEISRHDFQTLRAQRGSLEQVVAGNHFSSFGTLGETLTKWTGFSHTELKRAEMDVWVQDCWTNGKALESGSPLPELPELPSGLPEYMTEGRGPAHWYRRKPTF